MAIESLMVPRPESTVEIVRTGSLDVAEAVDVTLDAYKLLGYGGDPENAQRDLTQAFETNANLGVDGRLFARAPRTITFRTLLDVAEGKRPEGVSKAFVYPNLWTPGTEDDSYTVEELNRAPEEAVASLAIFNTSSTRNDGVDPILHYTGLPYDDYAKERWGGETTQLDAIEEDRISFEKDHPEFSLTAADHRDFAMLALMDRVRGIKGKLDPNVREFILNRGFMRIKALGRRAVGGGSSVGDVVSNEGQLSLAGSGGYAGSDFGLGVVVGPKNIELQAS